MNDEAEKIHDVLEDLEDEIEEASWVDKKLLQIALDNEDYDDVRKIIERITGEEFPDTDDSEYTIKDFINDIPELIGNCIEIAVLVVEYAILSLHIAIKKFIYKE